MDVVQNASADSLLTDKEIRDLRNALTEERGIVAANKVKSQTIFQNLQSTFASLSEEHVQNFEARGVRIIRLMSMLTPEVLTDKQKNDEFLKAYTEVLSQIKTIVKAGR